MFGEVVAPGALYASQVLEALRERGSGSPWALEEVEIHRPLVFPDGAFRTVQVVLGAEGGFEVVSREESGSVWDLHAEGRVATGSLGEPEDLDIAELRGGLLEVDPVEVYRGLAKAGIAFGPAFRSLSGLWSGAEEALGEVALPAELSGGGLVAHPALLDACFQVMSGVSALAEEKGVRLPVGWERLWLAGPLPERVFCRARLREGSGAASGPGLGEVWKVDLGIYGPTGEVLGGVEGFRLRRANRASLLGVRVDELLYEVEWRAGPSVGLRSAAFLRSPGELSSGLRPLAEFLAAEGMEGEELARLDAELERLSRGYALRALSELGWERASGERFEGDALRRRLKVTGDHEKLFGRLLSLLAEGGVLARDPSGGWEVTAGSEEALPESLEVSAGGGGSSVEEVLLRRCGESLSEVLRGRRDPLELLFGEEPGAADLYWKSPGARAVNRMVAEAVGSAVAGLPEGRRLSVLEVGAGTGATTGAVLPVLPAGRTDYEYTDISAGFFGEAERRFGDSGVSLRYRALDIERDPGEQGFGRHGADVVLAANVVHATRDLSETLGHCRKLLAPSGLLVLVEGTEARGVLDLTFGLLPGWWRFQDGYRPEYALAEPEVWERALGDAGFGEVSFLGDGLGQAVIVARGPAAVEREAGLFVLSAGGALGDAVSEELTRRGQRVEIGPSGGGREDWRRFFGSLSDEVPLRGVADLSGVRGDGAGLTTDELASEVRDACSGALALTQGLSEAGVRPESGLWFVTRGGQVLDRETAGALAGASLWGFGSVVALEHGDLTPRLLDLDPEGPPEVSAGALAEELLHPDRETRVARRGGERRVARLTRSGRRAALPEGGGWRLAPGPGGALDALRVEETAVSEVPLEVGQVRVAVEASGVNFHDVMVGMRLVDVEQALGGEVCGRVVDVGPGVERLSPGDRVAGFAAGTFGPEVVTRAELLALVPEGVSALDAATVPVAFVTAALAFEFAEASSKLGRGDRVLVHAGTGGVGQAAIQLARSLGLTVYATASAPKQEYLRSLGVSGVFNSRDTSFGEGIEEATGGAGVGMVLNSLTGEGFIEAGLSCLSEGGSFVEIGKRGIWGAEEMSAARPDVRYWVLAADRLGVEEPERVGRVLRGVMERVGSGELRPLPWTRWPLLEAGSALEHLREARHVGKLVLGPSALSSGRLRGDRSYLVTGGLGGIGLEVAGWLAERGAGAIVLNGRRAPDAGAAAAVEALKERGVEVRVELADVTDEAAVRDLLHRVDAELPPLGGVIHSVGVLSDAAVENQDWGRFEEVLWPKVLGAWRLHRATLDRELDLFVLFSSAVGVLGNAGQANHAAANAFLDQLARHRRALGLPGQAIAWGAWSEIGEAEEQRERIGEQLGALGAGWMTPEQGLAAFTRLVREDVGTSVAVSVDWSLVSSGSPLLEELIEPDDEGAGEEAGDLPGRLRELPPAEREGALIRFVQEELVSVLRLRTAPAADAGFFELGMDSLMAVELRNRLNRSFGGAVVLSNTVVFDHPDAARLGVHLAREFGDAGPADAGSDARDVRASVPLGIREQERVAIVGMACRFPAGPDVGAFWESLRSGVDAVTEGRPDGLMTDVAPGEAGPWGAYVEGLDRFDAEFFRIAPVEAELLDPQQRLLLEVSWAALEDAGLDPGSLQGSRTGVYGGVCSSDYQLLLSGSGGDRSSNLYRATGVTASTAVGRVAFALGLRGPAITVDTACSSSLVAVHQAAAALRLGEADLVLAGGVNAILASELTRIFVDGGMLAADGRCKTFDAAADGYVRGEGCGMVVLKRLSDAERDGDRILGVLLGSAVNQDGASAGLTVPNGPAQEEVIGAALERAGVEPSSVDYLEAHGTGTELGDPIEVAAAASVYGEGRDPKRPLLLGSVKTNIGHLEGAAGVAGLIKAVLAMREGWIPPHLHFERPNPRMAWDSLPVRVVTEATPWPEVDRPRRAAVSSFGYSGTNAHVVLEGYESEAAVSAQDAREVRLLPLSGKTPGALQELAGRYREWLTEDSPLSDLLSDMAWTAGIGRSHFGHRAGVVFGDADSLREQLEAVERGETAAGRGGKVGFLYTGQGSQWAGMGRELYESEPEFREVLERCEEVVREERGESLLSVLFGDDEGLDRTEWTQPALYALQSGLTALWAGVGVRPEVVFGHSVGELAAAQASGVFGLEEGLRFALRRGELMGSLPTGGATGGAMAAVFAPVSELESELRKTNGRVKGPGLSLAAENGAHSVVSGPRRLVESLRRRLVKRGVRVEGLVTSHAFHSALLDPVLDDLESAAAELVASAPEVPLVSDVSGRLLSGAPEGAYWRRQAREAVRFGTAVETLAELGVGVLVEVGPQGVLAPMALLSWPGDESPAVVSSLTRGGSGDFARAVAGAYEAGVEVSFAGLFAGEKRRRVSVPTYPFQRERYWVEAPRRRPAGGHALLGLRRDARDGEVSFETELSGSAPGWLSDHRVFGEVVAPGALYASQVLEALRERGSGSPWALEEVEIHRPLVFPDGAFRTVQVVLGAEGGFEVVSREESGSVWDLHAEGRVATGPLGEPEDLDIAELRGGLLEVDPVEVYRGLAKAGIAFGPAFRSLSGLWSGAEEALGEVALPAELSGGGLVAHPALLDACFQVMSGVLELMEEKGVRLPVGWERLWLAGPLPERVFCRARLREGSGAASGPGLGPGLGDVWKVDVGIYGPAGKALGGVEGFRLRRASRASLLGVRVDELLYGVEWRAGPSVGLRSAAFLRSPGEVSSGLRPAAAFLAAEGVDGDEAGRQREALERLSRRYALRALSELGWERAPMERFEGEELRRRLKVTGDHRKLFGRLLSLLSDGGVLAREPAGGWLVTAGSGEALPESLEVPEEAGGSSVEEGLLRRCGESLSEVLRGRRDPLELLFGEEPGAADLYWKSPGMRAVNRLVGEAVGALVSGLPEGRRLSVLEVGAGTGATTGAVLPALPAGRTDYEYTDISAGFFGEAERRFGDSGVSLRYRALDIERDPGEQGFGRHGADVVLAANVLHATRDLSETLGHCRKLLAPSGLLVLVEGTEASGFADLTFGLLPGWWRFQDGYRPEYALAEPEVWERALGDAGFGEVSFLGDGLGQAVIVARGPAEVEREAGLFVLSGDGALAETVSEELTRRGQRVERGPAGGDREAWRSFFGSLSDEVPLRGVVDLSGVRADGAGLTAEGLARELEEVCVGALSLTQGLSDARVRPESGLWFVTRGGQVVGRETAGALAGASLWGFGSVVGLEHGDLNPRLVDLDPALDPAVTAGVLVEELLHPDGETRVARRGGERRVARLVRLGPPAGEVGREVVRGDRSYLVTGGLGGIGLEVAGWLAERGAGAIVLNGRRAPDAGAAAAVEALRERGAEVRVELADVTDEAAVRDLLHRVDAELPPLGGVIHSVGALSDAALVNQDWERFEEVLWPKVLGAWRLHRATLDRELDLFVLFSSAAGVLGNAGQANHAAANAFLDQLARHRRALGLPGQAIAWGAWSEIGEAEEQRERIGERLGALGGAWMTPEQGLAAFTRLVREDVVMSVAAAVDWSFLATDSPFLGEIVETRRTTGEVSESADRSWTRLQAALPGERQKIMVSLLQAELCSALRLPSPPDPDVGFAEFGMDSLMAVNLRDRLNRAFPDAPLSNTAIFDYPTVNRLAAHLESELFPGEPEAEPAKGLAAPTAPSRLAAPTAPSRLAPPGADDRIAVIGMAGWLPGGPDLHGFWQMLREGREAITEGRPTDLFGAGGSPEWGAYVPGLDGLDAEFFGIPPAEALYVDPQQRMLLEVSWSALEDAGLDPRSLRGSRTGVYAGVSLSEYGTMISRSGQRTFHLYLYLGSSPSASVNRVSHFLGLEGPALAIETACSSSLVAMHHAIAGLRRKEMDLALAGGVNTILDADGFTLFRRAGILSPDGRCRGFDASANGLGRGEGCGMLVLKRLGDAEAAGDDILGLIAGSAFSQAGTTSGMVALNRLAEQRVLSDAVADAGVTPGEVDYLEAHGAGSLMADSIEIEAAAAVYGGGRDHDRPLLVGSVKSNVSNLEAAGGVAGMIKVLQSLRHQWIPPHLHFQEPNPMVDWERLPVSVVSEGTPWPAHPDRPRRAGISAFGISGTIAHLVMEEYRPPERSPVSPGTSPPDDASAPPDSVLPEGRRARLLPLSGGTREALSELAGRYGSWLARQSGDDPWENGRLADLAWSAGTGRCHLIWRACPVLGNGENLEEQLSLVAEGARGVRARMPEKVAFLFGGVAVTVSGRELYRTEPVVRATLDRLERVVREECGSSLLGVMFGDAAAGAPDDPEWQEPVTVAHGSALVALWESLGVRPDVVVGHGAGAIAAASAAGVFPPEDAMRFAVRRSARAGSGSPKVLDADLAGLEIARPVVPLLSSVTGERMGTEAPPAGYWDLVRRQPAPVVRLLAALHAQGTDAVVEIGSPLSSETDLERAFGRRKPSVLPGLLGTDCGEARSWADAVAAAYEAGLSVSFAGLFVGEQRRRVRIPTYPFQRERYWFE